MVVKVYVSWPMLMVAFGRELVRMLRCCNDRRRMQLGFMGWAVCATAAQQKAVSQCPDKPMGGWPAMQSVETFDVNFWSRSCRSKWGDCMQLEPPVEAKHWQSLFRGQPAMKSMSSGFPPGNMFKTTLGCSRNFAESFKRIVPINF